MVEREEMAGYPLRLPKTLYDRVRRLAAKEKRSINQQLVYLIEAQIKQYGDDENDLRQSEESDAS